MHTLSACIFVLTLTHLHRVSAEVSQRLNVSDTESTTCVDRLANCSALVSQGLCQLSTNGTLAIATQCARSCGLCATSTIRRRKRSVNRNRRPNTRSNVARSNARTRVQARRPAARSNVARSNTRTRSQARRPAASRPRVQARKPTVTRPRVQARRPVSKKRRPTSQAKTRARRPAQKPRAKAKRPTNKTKVRAKTKAKSATKSRSKRPTTKARSAAKTRSKVRARKPKGHAKKPTPKAANPKQQSRGKARANRRQPATRPNPKPQKPQTPTKPVESPQPVNFKPIGPNQIRVNNNVMVASQMEQTKQKTVKVSAQFNKMNGEVDGIIQGLDETLKQMDEDEKSQVSKLQMDFNSNMFQPRMKMSFGAIGSRWISKGKAVVSKATTFVSDNTPQPVKDLFNESAKQAASLLGYGSSRLQTSYAVFFPQNHEFTPINRALKPDVAFDFNQQSSGHEKLAQTLGSFATDFKKIAAELEQIFAQSKTGAAVLESLIKEAENNNIDIKAAKQKVQQVGMDFRKVRTELKETASTFKKTASDYGSVADNFEKTGAEPQVVRKPASEEPKKKEESNNDNSNPQIGNQNGQTPQTGGQQTGNQNGQNPQTGNQNNQQTPQTGNQQTPQTGNQQTPQTGNQQQTPQTGNQQTPQTGNQNNQQTPQTGNQQQTPQTGNQQTPQTGNQQQTPQTGNQQTPQTGNQQTPQTGSQQTPQTGNQQTPQTGNQQQTPQTGNQQTPQTGNQQTPQTGNQQQTPQTGNQQQTPQTGNQQTPQTGNQQTPQTGNQNNQQTPQTGNQQTPQTGNQNNQQNQTPKDETPAGDEVTMQCKNQNFVSNADGSTAGMVCKNNKAGTGEVFRLVPLANNKFAFYANKQYCTVEAEIINCNSPKAEAKEQQFDKIVPRDDNTIFKCYNEKFLALTPENVLKCVADTEDKAETFKVTVTSGNSKDQQNNQQNQQQNNDKKDDKKTQKIMLQCVGGKYVSIDKTQGKSQAICDKQNSEDDMHFMLEETETTNKYFIQASDGSYCSASDKDDSLLTCTNKEAGTAESFEQQSTNNKKIRFKCRNGKYMNVDSEHKIKCIADKEDLIEDFSLTNVEG